MSSRPGGKEGTQAEDLLRTYGEEAARFAIDYGIRQAGAHEILNACLWRLMQYVPDAIAALEERKSASAESEARERAEADRKRAIEKWYAEGTRGSCRHSRKRNETRSKPKSGPTSWLDGPAKPAGPKPNFSNE